MFIRRDKTLLDDDRSPLETYIPNIAIWMLLRILKDFNFLCGGELRLCLVGNRDKFGGVA